MAARPTKQELQAKYGDRFADIKELSFGVEFPDGQKAILQPLEPVRYNAFMDALKGAVEQLGEIDLDTFEVFKSEKKEGEPEPEVAQKFKGRDVTPPDKVVWELSEDGKPKKDDDGLKIPQLDKEGEIVIRKFPNYRIKTVPDGDLKEFPRKLVHKSEVQAYQVIEMFGKLAWGNAQKILVILFPENKERFTDEYVARHTNVPFLLEVMELTIDMNRLDFMLPFLSDFFPALKYLFPDKMKDAKKQTVPKG